MNFPVNKITVLLLLFPTKNDSGKFPVEIPFHSIDSKLFS